MRIFFSTLILMAICVLAQGQQSISGTIKNLQGEAVAGAHISVEGSLRLAVSNDKGDFVLSKMPLGSHQLQVTHISYEPYNVTLEQSDEAIAIEIVMLPAMLLSDEVVISAVRASASSPVSNVVMQKAEIEKLNLGQDLPYLLNYSPSIVTTSDAGAGVGYTSMRIRGSDQSRINVTINGIPINDAESQGVFYVNMPDFASSVESIQIQRGVGTSTNGSGAFGASVNLQTNDLRPEAFGEVNLGYGSFNTQKYSASFGTGLIKDHWNFEGRLSYIKSDGFIDRATSDLKSFYLSGGYHSEKTNIKALAFSGKEITYQAWYGVPESRLNNDSLGMIQTAANEGMNEEETDNLFNSNSRTYNFYTYDNQVDNYSQSHYQLHLSHAFSDAWQVNLSGHYTRGLGYFEQYRDDDSFANYNLEDLVIGDSTITSTNLVRRRWLDNHFYGATYSVIYKKPKLELIIGGGLNRYDGDHYGEIIWAQFAGNASIGDKYYDNKGVKDDFNIYAKLNYRLATKLQAFMDMQYRNVQYSTAGIDNDLRVLDVNDDLNFFNPKLGLTYFLSDQQNLFASYAIGNREPTRNDYIDAPLGEFPLSEQMHNLEIGWKIRKDKWDFVANIYLMEYQNQLVLTGALNDVGSPIRTNVDKSFRRGLELQGQYIPNDWFRWGANISCSQNKIREFTEVIYDYTVDFEVLEIAYNNTDISFSPDIVASNQFTFIPLKNFEISILTKYVGSQYLDNTSNVNRSIAAYVVNDIHVHYKYKLKSNEEFGCRLMINNFLNEEYANNGYTYTYRYEETITQNYFYPQAGINFLIGIYAKF